NLYDVRKQGTDKQKWNHPPAEQEHYSEAQSGAWIPGRDAEMRIGLDEADRVKQNVSRDIDDADSANRQRRDARIRNVIRSCCSAAFVRPPLPFSRSVIAVIHTRCFHLGVFIQVFYRGCSP